MPTIRKIVIIHLNIHVYSTLQSRLVYDFRKNLQNKAISLFSWHQRHLNYTVYAFKVVKK